MIALTEKDGAVFFSVRVVPRASKSELAGTLEGALRVRLAAPPVDGAANAELIRFLAKKLGIAKSEVRILSGETARFKRISVANLSADGVRAILQA